MSGAPDPYTGQPVNPSGCRRFLAMPAGVNGTAVMRGPWDEHRLVLARWCGTDTSTRFALWAGLNPSGAEPQVDDMTIHKEWVFTGLLGLSRYAKVNAATLRRTDPSRLQDETKICHPDNLPLIRRLAGRAAIRVAATGDVPKHLRPAALEMFRVLALMGPVLCLGCTRAGWPRHPSRLGYAVKFEPFDHTRIAG